MYVSMLFTSQISQLSGDLSNVTCTFSLWLRQYLQIPGAPGVAGLRPLRDRLRPWPARCAGLCAEGMLRRRLEPQLPGSRNGPDLMVYGLGRGSRNDDSRFVPGF
jgi:hypothetical protein